MRSHDTERLEPGKSHSLEEALWFFTKSHAQQTSNKRDKDVNQDNDSFDQDPLNLNNWPEHPQIWCNEQQVEVVINENENGSLRHDDFDQLNEINDQCNDALNLVEYINYLVNPAVEAKKSNDKRSDKRHNLFKECRI